jgi:hypothetical protein
MKINFTQLTIYLTSLVSFLSFRLFFFLGSLAPKLASLNPFRSSFGPVCFRRLSSIRYLLTSVNYFLLFSFLGFLFLQNMAGGLLLISFVEGGTGFQHNIWFLTAKTYWISLSQWVFGCAMAHIEILLSFS